MKMNKKSNSKKNNLNNDMYSYQTKYEDNHDNNEEETKDESEIDNNIYYDKFSFLISLNGEIYIIKFIKKNISKILIICDSIEECTSLYDFSIELSYEQFYELGKSFKVCDNIDDVFDLIKNTIKMKNEKKANILLESIENNKKMILHLIIPLLNGKSDEIKIEFLKHKKELKTQYIQLKNKYLKLKNIILKNDLNGCNCFWIIFIIILIYFNLKLTSIIYRFISLIILIATISFLMESSDLRMKLEQEINGIVK